MARDVIVTENLTKHYGKVVGVESLDLRVSEGEIFGFLGPNGAGKTTTMRLLMGLLAPTEGSASILDLDCWKRSVEVKRLVGYLPGEPAMYKRLTGDRLIRFVAGFGADEKAGFDFAERLELDIKRQLKEYSRGMKQKLALTLALMRRAPLVIMDEPTNGLDPLTQYVLYEILQEQRQAGVTILFSSHNLHEVERISDRVGIIKDGRMATVQKIEELRALKLRNIDVTFKDRPPEGTRGAFVLTSEGKKLSRDGELREYPPGGFGFVVAFTGEEYVACVKLTVEASALSATGRCGSRNG